jgi:hypothetical protein
VSKPLKPSFLFHRQGGDAIWVFLKYERLGDYCTDCGMISHKKHGCRSPPKLITPEKYKVSLKVMILSNLLPEPFTILELTSGESSQSSSLASHLHRGELTQSHGANINPKIFVSLSQVLMSCVKPANNSTNFLKPLKDHISLFPKLQSSLLEHPSDNTHCPSINASTNFSPIAARNIHCHTLINHDTLSSNPNFNVNIFQILPGLLPDQAPLNLSSRPISISDFTSPTQQLSSHQKAQLSLCYPLPLLMF